MIRFMLDPVCQPSYIYCFRAKHLVFKKIEKK
jgi:hypothetical protein